MIAFELVIESMLVEASAASLDGEILELEPNQFGYCITYVMNRLRQAEKDAARYRWLRDVACYSEWHVVGSADPSVWDVIVDEYIDEAMQCK